MQLGQSSTSTSPKPWAGAKAAGLEIACAAGLSVLVLVLETVLAGAAEALWRDEVTSVYIAARPTLGDMWRAMDFDSVPALGLLVLRWWQQAGLTSDWQIRTLGLLVAGLYIVAMWFTARSLRAAGPLLGLTVTAISIWMLYLLGGARAYGLAAVLLVANVGVIWRMVQQTTWGRTAAALVVSVLSVHSLFYNWIYLAALIVAGGVLLVGQRRWRDALLLCGIGAISAGSMLIYVPMVRRVSQWGDMWQVVISPQLFLQTLRQALAPVPAGVWLIGILLLVVLAIIAAWKPAREEQRRQSTFCLLVLLLGVGGHVLFLVRLRYFLNPWYFMCPMVLVAALADGLAGAPWPRWRGVAVRLALVLLALGVFLPTVWPAMQVRRTNIDEVAQVLSERVAPNDLVVVDPFFYCVTFNRYYRGPAEWVTVPNTAEHALQRYDQMKAKLGRSDGVQDVVQRVRQTLNSGRRVWVVGSWRLANPSHLLQVPPPWLEAPPWSYVEHMPYWSMQVGAALVEYGGQAIPFAMEGTGPVSNLENAAVLLVLPR